MTILERFSQLGEIEISADADNANKRRLAILSGGLQWYPIAKQIILDLKVYYLDTNGNKLTQQRLPAYDKRLIADTTTKVDAQFGVIEKPVEQRNEQNEITNQAQIDAYNNAPTEYDAVLALALTTPAPQACVTFIQLRDAQGKFDI